MTDNRGPVRRPLRYEVRVRGVYGTGNAFNISKTRAAKLDVAIMAVMEVGRTWAVQNGSVLPGTTVSLVDTNDGGEVMSLRWNGFDCNTLEEALRILGAQGFQLKEVADNG